MIYEYVNEIVELLKDSEEQRHTHTHTHTLVIFCSVRAANLKTQLTLHFRCAINISCVSEPIKKILIMEMNCLHQAETNQTEAASKCAHSFTGKR